MKFTFGKKQKVSDIELDTLFTDLQAVLQKHPLVPKGDVDALVSEWINDILFVAGKITEEELQEVMQTLEKVETSQESAAVASEEDSDEDNDKDDDDK